MWRNPFGQDGRPLGMTDALGRQVRDDQIVVKESPMPANMGVQFLQFIERKSLPNGEQTTLPTLTKEEIALLGKPYNQWAPAPFNANPIRSETCMIRFVLATSGVDGLYDPARLFSGTAFQDFSYIAHDLEFSKNRLWNGLVPLSDRRWRQKRLDEPENLEKAIEYLEKAGEFMYFNLSRTVRKMRTAYNTAYGVLEHFDTVLEAHYRATNQQPERRAKAAHLWTEFYFSRTTFVSARVHAWYLKRADVLLENLMGQMRAVPLDPGGRVWNLPQKELLDKYRALLDYVNKADYTILFPLVGYKNELAHWRHLSNPPIVNWAAYNGSQPLKTYPPELEQRTGVQLQRMQWHLRQAIFRDSITRAACVDTQKELRGELLAVEFHEELWIASLKQWLEPLEEPNNGVLVSELRWGFVGYRLHYEHSDEEWALFQESFKNELAGWDEGVAGADAVKSKLAIKWIDGRELGILEGDVEAARGHFATGRQTDSDTFRGFLTPPAFLVADKASIDSYLKRPELPGQNLIDDADLGSWITVADFEFDAARAARDRESPGFNGSMRVLESVLIDDVWAGLWYGGNQLKTSWPIARDHPSQLYVGPTTAYQVENWNKFGGVIGATMSKAQAWERQGRFSSSV
ncbi:hypothetical protein B0H67DRAFT_640712 [Lasiosphaeris hirsuta]|uniref:Uncharacterized protein n=1 Tax=Lasiosphaeris hirsuta TaxID=260670 RepID=A0AA40E172_9PEZI|nr:hypothetical protein B0H67DRAFT_640712 [Lasiosphaeris hirsuta]